MLKSCTGRVLKSGSGLYKWTIIKSVPFHFTVSTEGDTEHILIMSGPMLLTLWLIYRNIEALCINHYITGITFLVQ